MPEVSKTDIHLRSTVFMPPMTRRKLEFDVDNDDGSFSRP